MGESSVARACAMHPLGTPIVTCDHRSPWARLSSSPSPVGARVHTNEADLTVPRLARGVHDDGVATKQARLVAAESLVRVGQREGLCGARAGNDAHEVDLKPAESFAQKHCVRSGVLIELEEQAELYCPHLLAGLRPVRSFPIALAHARECSRSGVRVKRGELDFPEYTRRNPPAEHEDE